MRYDSFKHHRRSIRLKGYDYSLPGAYYVTICTKNREYLFGDVIDGKMILNEFGEIACDGMVQTVNIRSDIKIDEFV
ncbi:transposase, partial [bacterium]|nr:transposase [bacterium]